jgi:serine/threonine protein kinase
MKVLISTLRDAPPILDPSQCSHEYTSMFAQFVQLCLNKDPLMRPSAFELMKHPFITKAPPPEYLVNSIHMYNIKELQARSKDGKYNWQASFGYWSCFSSSCY